MPALIFSFDRPLGEIKTKVIIDEKLLIDSFFKAYYENIHNILAGNGFEITNVVISEKTLFLTEIPDIMFIDYSIDCDCTDINEGQRNNAILKMHGDGKYNHDSQSYEELRCFNIELNYCLPDGTEKTSKSVFIYAGGIIGHRDVIHTIKSKIEWE
jgi:hypothetical protein